MRRLTRIENCLSVFTWGILACLQAGCGQAVSERRHDSEMPLRPASDHKAGTELSFVNTTSTSQSPPAKSVLEQAAKESKYTFIFVWKQDDDATRRMRNVFMTALAKVPERAIATEVLISAANQREFVEEYGLERAPFPLVLAIAPNGAITGGFPTQFSDEDLLGAFATPATEKAMKQLQAGKLVLLCVQNDSSTEREAALAAVREFQREPRFANASEIVMLDPADKAEASFLNDLKINPAIAAAVTVVLAPPGSPIGIFEGPVSKQHLIESIDKAGSGCCPGGKCGPNGCGPK